MRIVAGEFNGRVHIGDNIMTQSKIDIAKRVGNELKDFTNTLSAFLLFNQVLDEGTVVNVKVGSEIIAEENKKEKPKIVNVIREIIMRSQDEKNYGWKEDENNSDSEILEVNITIGGAVYQVKFSRSKKELGDISTNITKLEVCQEAEKRGQLFFDLNEEVAVNLNFQNEELSAKTQNGIVIEDSSVNDLPNAFKNEILAGFANQLVNCDSNEKADALLLMATGSGKGFIAGGLPAAVSQITITIVPDKTLADQQKDETKKIMKVGKGREPSIFTLDLLEEKYSVDPLVEVDETLSEEIKKILSDILEGNEVNFTEEAQKYDAVILDSSHYLFKYIKEAIKASLVIIDESHKHTFRSEDREFIRQVRSNNVVLAMTATPTSFLYEIFEEKTLDDVNLASVIELRLVRPIKAEEVKLSEKKLIDKAVISYFTPYYLEEGDLGYVSPKTLLQSLKIQKPNTSENLLRKEAIELAMERNIRIDQRNMAFSDDAKVRATLTNIYNKLAKGDRSATSKYQAEIQRSREEARFKEICTLDKILSPLKEEETPDQREVKLNKIWPKSERSLNLQAEIKEKRRQAIEAVINKHALALLLNEKADNIGSLIRKSQLRDKLTTWRADSNDKKAAARVVELGEINKTSLEEIQNLFKTLLLQNHPNLFNPLGEPQKTEFINLILDRVIALIDVVVKEESIADWIYSEENKIDLTPLGLTDEYAFLVDKETTPANKKLGLAQMELGIVSHLISDDTLATGISMKDIMNVQMITTYSPQIEENPDVINGVLSSIQAVGRPVRADDGRARVQQYIDDRCEDRLTVRLRDILDKEDFANNINFIAKNRREKLKVDSVSKLRVITQNCMNKIRKSTVSYAILQELKDILADEEKTDAKKLKAFYKKATDDATLQCLESDKNKKAISYFLLAITIVLLTLVAILPGLIAAAIVYKLTGEKPWELIQSGKLEEEIDRIKEKMDLLKDQLDVTNRLFTQKVEKKEEEIVVKKENKDDTKEGKGDPTIKIEGNKI